MDSIISAPHIPEARTSLVVVRETPVKAFSIRGTREGRIVGIDVGTVTLHCAYGADDEHAIDVCDHLIAALHEVRAGALRRLAGVVPAEATA